jgi:hypothetical protein
VLISAGRYESAALLWAEQAMVVFDVAEQGGV